MILYTIMPSEYIFNRDNEEYHKNNYVDIEYMNEKIQAIELSDGNYIINRLLSSNPSAFLNPGLMPGRVIKAIVPGGNVSEHR